MEKVSALHPLHRIASAVATGPAKLLLSQSPDHGPGGPGYAALAFLGSALVTSPVWVPLVIVGNLLRPSGEQTAPPGAVA